MARDASRSMSRQFSAIVSRTGRAVRGRDYDSVEQPAPPPRPPRRTPPPTDPSAQEASRPYRRSRARLLARKWRLGRVRPNPIGYAVGVALAIMLAVATSFGGGAAAYYSVGYYQSHIGDIQKIANLKNHASSVILDRNGQVLTTIADSGDFNYYVPLEQINPLLVTATLDTEDHTFWSNVGIDFVGTARAAIADLANHGAVQGGSTVTQQLVKNIVARDSTKTLTRKLNEAILAYGVYLNYKKPQVLEMYLNTIFYGDSNYGIEAAAKNYFGYKPYTPPGGSLVTANMQLTLAQAALLAGVPNSPTRFQPDVYTCDKAPCPDNQWTADGHEQVVYDRTNVILTNMLKYGDITQAQYNTALAQVHDMLVNQTIGHWMGVSAGSAEKANSTNLAYHFVKFVTDELANDYGVTDLGSAGLRVYTTLDLNLNEYAQKRLHYYIDEPHAEPWYYPYCKTDICPPLSTDPASLAHNGAMVAIDQHTGDILAMVGSVDPYSTDPHVLGFNNITTSKFRSMGSSTKPIMYATALQMGWNPGIMMQDSPVCFPVPSVDPTNNKPIQDSAAPACKGWYVPHDYEVDNLDGRIPLRRALADSLNIPAVEGMSFVGDNALTANAFLAMAGRLGITTLSASRMGPTTALGTQEIPLIELTNAYATFANAGKHLPYRAILKVERADGTVLYQAPGQPAAQQVLSPQSAYMLTSVLSDNFARYPFFKLYNPLHLDDFPNLQLAAKTGTSSGSTGPLDIVTVGYSPYLTVGAWMGNTDPNDPMYSGIIGVAGAGYVFHDVMDWAAKNYKWDPNAAFPIPPDLARGGFNCTTGLAPYKGSTSADLNCKWQPLNNKSNNPYDPQALRSGNTNSMPDQDWYIQEQDPLQS